MKDNKSPARCSNQYALKQTSHTPGEYRGKMDMSPRGGVEVKQSLSSYKSNSKSPRG